MTAFFYNENWVVCSKCFGTGTRSRKNWGLCSKCFGTGTRSRKSTLLNKNTNADSGGIAALETEECNGIQQYGTR